MREHDKLCTSFTSSTASSLALKKIRCQVLILHSLVAATVHTILIIMDISMAHDP